MRAPELLAAESNDRDRSEAKVPDADQKQAPVARREALKKLGKYAAYTAPALLATLEGAKAQVSSVVDA